MEATKIDPKMDDRDGVGREPQQLDGVVPGALADSDDVIGLPQLVVVGTPTPVAESFTQA